MIQPTTNPLAALYAADETAWLDQTAALLLQGSLAQIDVAHLAEYLVDMARRDRREVQSRLVILLVHLLKWDYQSDRRSGPWLSTILEQQFELRKLIVSATLRNHAVKCFDESYEQACKQAAAETGLPQSGFPVASPWTLEAALLDRGAAT